MMRKTLFTVFILVGLVMLLASGPMMGSASAALSASVTSVSLSKANVCNGDKTQTVSATVTGSGYSSDRAAANTTDCDDCGASNNYCGTGNSTVTKKKTVATTTITVTDKNVTASATDSNGNSTDPQSGASPLSFSKALTAAGIDGKIDVTVSATASEKVTKNYTSATVSYYKGGNCTTSNNIVIPAASVDDFSTEVTNTSGVATNTGTKPSYLLDLAPPTAKWINNTPDPVDLGGEESFHFQLKDASSDTKWDAVVTATPTAGGTPITGNVEGTVGSSTDGITETTNVGPDGLPIGCDASVGTYSIAATVKTHDLCGGDYEDIVVNGDDFEVMAPTIDLVAQTIVISEQTGGIYGIGECFVDSVKQQKNKLIVNNTPGSVHLGATVRAVPRTDGVCVGSGTISGGYLKLTLQTWDDLSGFSFMQTGNSPWAHIFVGEVPAGDVLDYHSGLPLVEVTDLVSQVKVGQTITINLSGLGEIPLNYTIFARAHANFGATSTLGQPGPDTDYMFSSEAETNINGVLTGPSTSVYFISGNPTQTMDVLTGLHLGVPASCDAYGNFMP